MLCPYPTLYCVYTQENTWVRLCAVCEQLSNESLGQCTHCGTSFGPSNISSDIRYADPSDIALNIGCNSPPLIPSSFAHKTAELNSNIEIRRLEVPLDGPSNGPASVPSREWAGCHFWGGCHQAPRPGIGCTEHGIPQSCGSCNTAIGTNLCLYLSL